MARSVHARRACRELALSETPCLARFARGCRWLAGGDGYFVHTADFEGMPNAVMEAMAMALR